MFGKKRVLRKNLRDMDMTNVPIKSRQENIKTSAVYRGVSQPLPNNTPFNSWQTDRFNDDQSISLASVPFTVLASATVHQSAQLTVNSDNRYTGSVEN